MPVKYPLPHQATEKIPATLLTKARELLTQPTHPHLWHPHDGLVKVGARIKPVLPKSRELQRQQRMQVATTSFFDPPPKSQLLGWPLHYKLPPPAPLSPYTLQPINPRPTPIPNLLLPHHAFPFPPPLPPPTNVTLTAPAFQHDKESSQNGSHLYQQQKISTFSTHLKLPSPQWLSFGIKHTRRDFTGKLYPSFACCSQTSSAFAEDARVHDCSCIVDSHFLFKLLKLSNVVDQRICFTTWDACLFMLPLLQNPAFCVAVLDVRRLFLVHLHQTHLSQLGGFLMANQLLIWGFMLSAMSSSFVSFLSLFLFVLWAMGRLRLWAVS